MEDGKAGGQKWWEKDEGTTEYEADIDIPLMLQQDNKIVVEDTEDIYSMPARPVSAFHLYVTTNIYSLFYTDIVTNIFQ